MASHDAFISYSHTSDRRLAPAIESGLEKLARPLFSLRAIDVFRDETSLAANPGLWSTIVEHLSNSKWFVMMASPASAASRWCNEEAAWWLEHRSAATMLVVVTDGEIAWDSAKRDFDWSRTTALSPSLQGHFTEEPLYVDLRWTRQREALTLTLADARFRGAILDLASPIRGVPKDQLDGEDVRQLRRTKQIARAAVLLIAAASVVATWQAIEATRQRNSAVVQRDRALSRQLSAQASGLHESEPVIALLLAAQGYATSPTLEASTELLRILQAIPAERIIEFPTALNSLATTPDAAVAVVGDSAGQTLRIDLQSGESRVLPGVQTGGPLQAVLAVAISANGSAVASGGFDQKIHLWRGNEAPRVVGTGPEAHEGFIMGLAFSPDGNLLASAGTDGRVLVHDLRAGSTRVLQPHSFLTEMGTLSFSPDGTVLVAGGDKASLGFFRMDGSAPRPGGRTTAASPSSSVEAIAFTADGKQVACAYFDRVVMIFDVASGKVLERVDLGKFAFLNTLALAPDGNTFITGHDDGAVIVWQRQPYQAGWQSRVIHRHLGAVKGVAFLPDRGRVLTVGFDGRAVVSRPIDLPPLASRSTRNAPQLPANPDSNPMALVSADGQTRFTSDGSSIQAWDTRTQKPRSEPKPLGLRPTLMALSPDGRMLAVGGNPPQPDLLSASRRQPDTRVALLTAPDLSPIVDFSGMAGSIGSFDGFGPDLYFTPDSRLLVMKTDRGLTLWDAQSLQRFDEAVMLPATNTSYGFIGNESRLLMQGPTSGTIIEVSLAPAEWFEQACNLARRVLTRDEWARYVSRELPYAPACRGTSRQ